MARVLVVEDSPTQARLIQFTLENEGFIVDVAGNGREALDVLARGPADLVATDLDMPEMDGMQLVEEVRRQYPLVPVILMTAQGSEEIAAEALRKGAASYVPKRHVRRDLIATINGVLAAAKLDRRHEILLEALTHTDTGFVLGNDPELLPHLVNHLQEQMVLLKLSDSNGVIRLGVALSEALTNALYHGNLELGSELRQGGGEAHDALARERRLQAPYRDRHIHVSAKLSRTQGVFVVRDEGPGFDPSTVPDPTDPANLEKETGRGLLLIRAFMDDVSHNPTGNEITMVKRRDP
jgi:CheY-like chemotaxis protein/anti-sigma regulatory factor (Ser/Thr protein kinase)